MFFLSKKAVKVIIYFPEIRYPNRRQRKMAVTLEFFFNKPIKFYSCFQETYKYKQVTL